MGRFPENTVAIDPGDRGTIRFAYPYRLATGDLFVGVLEEQGLEAICRVEHAAAVPLGDITVTYVVETIRQTIVTDRGNRGAQKKGT